MTGCAETILLGPTVPSSQPKSEHSTLGDISYAGMTLYPRRNEIEEVPTENSGSSPQQEFRSPNVHPEMCALGGKAVASHSFPQEATLGCTQQGNSSSYQLMDSCPSTQLGFPSPLCVTPPSSQHGVSPPVSHTASALYTTIISSKEMAAHEASNFKDVKGVYKNCRGIWAAQWTDERGQRHTKYFNPKYYSTEAEARREAFKFKVYIAREIELRGGVQKRRSCAAVTTISNTIHLNDCLVQQSYAQDRSRRVYRGKISKAIKLRNILERAELEKNGYTTNMTFYPSPYMNAGQYDARSPGSSSAAPALVGGFEGLLYHDYMMSPSQPPPQPPPQPPQQPMSYDPFALHHTNSMIKASGLMRPVSSHPCVSVSRRPFPMERMNPEADMGMRSLVNHTGEMDQSGGSSTMISRMKSLYTPSTAGASSLMYSASSFDPIYFSPHDTAASGESRTEAHHPSVFPLCMSYDLGSNSLLHFSENPSGVGSSMTAPPPHNTKLCACGCGILALAPSRYAAHHHGLVAPANPNSWYTTSLTQSGGDPGEEKTFHPMGCGTPSRESGFGHDSAVPSRVSKVTKSPMFPILVDRDLKRFVSQRYGDYETLVHRNFSSTTTTTTTAATANSPSRNPFYAFHHGVANDPGGQTILGFDTTQASKCVGMSRKRLKQVSEESPKGGEQRLDSPNYLPEASPAQPSSQAQESNEPARYPHSGPLTQVDAPHEALEPSNSRRPWSSTASLSREDPETSPGVMPHPDFPTRATQEEAPLPPRPREEALETHGPMPHPDFADSSTSFPFAMSWTKCFPFYASYPSEHFNSAASPTKHVTLSHMSPVLTEVHCSGSEEASPASKCREPSGGSTDLDAADLYQFAHCVALKPDKSSPLKLQDKTAATKELSVESKSSPSATPSRLSAHQDSPPAEKEKHQDPDHSQFVYSLYLPDGDQASLPINSLDDPSPLSSTLHPMY